MRAGARPALALTTALLAAPAMALELDWSGFLRAGYVHADQTDQYQAIIGGQRGWRRDSIVGAQLDARLAPRWSAVAQLTLAPAGQDNRRSRGELSLAALSYRASNELTLQAGKLRLPLLLNSENTGVGGAYSMARLPDVVYALTANTHFTGAQASRGWDLPLGELSVDAYAGRSEVLFRLVRPGTGAAPAQYREQPAARGAVLTLRRNDGLYRLGLHHFGLDEVAGLTPAGAIGGAAARVATAGASVGLGGDWRASGELVRQLGAGAGPHYRSSGAYLALERQLGAWTPYLTLARLLTRLPPQPGAVEQVGPRVASAALGASLAAGAGAAWKGEWQRVGCRLPDGRGAAPEQRCRTAWSLSYARTF